MGFWVLNASWNELFRLPHVRFDSYAPRMAGGERVSKAWDDLYTDWNNVRIANKADNKKDDDHDGVRLHIVCIGHVCMYRKRPFRGTKSITNRTVSCSRDYFKYITRHTLRDAPLRWLSGR